VVSDEDFIRALESTTLPASAFSHEAHVRAGWWYLHRYPLGDAIDRFTRSLRVFADAKGATGKYHETMTVAWMLLIAERLATARDLDWSTFASQHPELFTKPSLLARYYSPATLASAHARSHFVMPAAAFRNDNDR
jgi:hypothetical protein